jgi:type II secretory pathway pseudopilin PulG
MDEPCRTSHAARSRQHGLLSSSAGITYLGAIIIVVIMGIMMGITGQSWRMIMKRERETELLFRGMEYKRAIEKWHGTGQRIPGSPPPGKLKELKDLLQGKSLQKVRYIRKLYKDPITGEDFTVLQDPVKGIVGVASSSEEEPLKKGNFPKGLESLENQTQYRKWAFGRMSSIRALTSLQVELPR